MFLYVCFNRKINGELTICIESSQRMAAAYFKVQFISSLDGIGREPRKTGDQEDGPINCWMNFLNTNHAPTTG
jgi:hypothetical protein